MKKWIGIVSIGIGLCGVDKVRAQCDIFDYEEQIIEHVKHKTLSFAQSYSDETCNSIEPTDISIEETKNKSSTNSEASLILKVGLTGQLNGKHIQLVVHNRNALTHATKFIAPTIRFSQGQLLNNSREEHQKCYFKPEISGGQLLSYFTSDTNKMFFFDRENKKILYSTEYMLMEIKAFQRDLEPRLLDYVTVSNLPDLSAYYELLLPTL